MKRFLQFGQSIANQFSRLATDYGQNDKSFYHQEYKLKEAVAKLKDATDEVIRASNRLQMSLIEKAPPTSIGPDQLH